MHLSRNTLRISAAVSIFAVTAEVKINEEKINKAFSVLGVIKRNFIHMDKSTFVLLYKAMVSPHLEYSNSVWCPFKKGDIESIEKVQKRATKLYYIL